MDQFFRKLHDAVTVELETMMKDKYYSQGKKYSSPQELKDGFKTMRVFLNCFKTSTKEAVQLLAFFPYDDNGVITNPTMYEMVMPISKDIVAFQITKIRDLYNNETLYPSIILGQTLVGHRDGPIISYAYNENENLYFQIGQDCKLV